MRIYLITSKEESVCPCCGSPLKYRDSRRRVHRKAGGGKEWCLIRRLKCSNDRCRRLHNELPDCMCPYKHYDAGLIEDVVDGVVGEEDIETEDYPCSGTMKHWRWWSQMNEKNGSLTPKNYEITRKASNGFIFLSNLYFLLPRYS